MMTVEDLQAIGTLAVEKFEFSRAETVEAIITALGVNGRSMALRDVPNVTYLASLLAMVFGYILFLNADAVKIAESISALYDFTPEQIEQRKQELRDFFKAP